MAQPTAALPPSAAAGAAAGVPAPAPQDLLGPDGKLSMTRIRQQYPMYSALSDDQLLIGLHQKVFPQYTPRQFYGAVNYDTDAAKNDPLNDMSGPAKFVAGYGKTTSDVIDTAKRIGNMVGLGDYDQQAAAEDQRVGAPLTKTGAGFAGKLAGDIALTAVPAAKTAQAVGRGVGVAGSVLPNALARTVVNGAAPIAGAVAAGAGTGAALSPDNLSGGAEAGAVLAPLGELGGRVAQGLYQGGKAVIEPLWQQGRQRILQRTLDRFASDPAALRAGANNPQVLVPGYTPTLAEATGDTGIAQLQRGAQTVMPGVANTLSDANSQRMQAYRAALDDLAGNDGKADFYRANREGNAQQNYGEAYGTPLQMTPELQQQFTALQSRPSVQSAQGTAQNLAAESGMNVNDPSGSVAGMHYVKKALDDQVGSAMNAGNTSLGSAVGDTRDQFLAALQQASPSYAKAMAQYASDSRPINQMAIGQALRDKMVPALGDFNEDLARSRAQQYAQALRDSGGTARRATGLDSATLENTLDAPQMQTVQDIARDAARYTQSQEAGRAPGSPTAQYLGAQNIMQQALGPLGLPTTGLDSALGRAAAGVMSIPFRATSSRTEELLARALRDPAVAAQILNTRDAAPYIARLQPGAANAAVVAGDDK